MSDSFGKDVDLGNGWSFSWTTEAGVEGKTGIIILGPAPPQCMYHDVFKEMWTGLCGGGLFFTNSLHAQKEGRPMWTVQSWEPLTLTPSILCKCGGQHGYIRGGVYVPC